MRNFFQINQGGTTILLVTHDAKIAAQSDRVLFMKDGQIVDELHLGKMTNTLSEDRVEKVTRTMLKVEV